MGRSRESEMCKVSSVICSKHFRPDDFARRLDFQCEEGILPTPWLKRDKFGKTAFPSIYANVGASDLKQQQPGSTADRDKNRAIFFRANAFLNSISEGILTSY